MKHRSEIGDRKSGKLPRCGLWSISPFAAAALTISCLAAQEPARSIVKPSDVEFLYPEQVNVQAGQTTKVALHFRVGEGLHINSHTPREEFLIPTTFSIPESSGVRLDAANYPIGSDLTLPSDPTNKLSVYTGEFAIDAQIVATKGDHLVEAKLHYQACNNSVCLPPRTITAAIDVVGK
jgi:DsbC/DsbD-like thiol-disulfide interchange protein